MRVELCCPLSSDRRSYTALPTSYPQSHFNRVSLKPIHQLEKSELEHLKNIQRKINRKLNYTLLDISTPSGISNSILGHYWVASLNPYEPGTRWLETELSVSENEDVISRKVKDLGSSWLLLQGLMHLEGDSAWLLTINRN